LTSSSVKEKDGYLLRKDIENLDILFVQ